MQKEYIGDGIYLSYDGYAYILTTEDGVSVSNLIYIEPEYMDLIIRCSHKMKPLSLASATVNNYLAKDGNIISR